MNSTQQYIAEHLDPLDTAAGWGSGEAFADAILENADDGTPLEVTREDLIDYWRQARRKAEAERLERTPLQVWVEYCPRGNRQRRCGCGRRGRYSGWSWFHCPAFARHHLLVIPANAGIQCLRSSGLQQAQSAKP